MSTQPLQSAWKQEVNQRLAAHKNRKGSAGVATQNSEAAGPGNSRAAEAAARVAARYAKAPTYTQMQAEEARVAVRAAEIATQVAMEAQATAESALAGLHAASVEQPLRGPATVENISNFARSVVEPSVAESRPAWPQSFTAGDSGQSHAKSSHEIAVSHQRPASQSIVTQEVIDGRSFDLHWEPDIPARAVQMTVPTPARAQENFALSVEDWWTPAQVNAAVYSEPIEVDAQSLQANLIHFPRELVAARKMRPRLAETVVGAAVDNEAQLSIFEVDPGTESIEPTTAPQAEPSHSTWTGPVWSGMELDAHPARVEAPQAQPSPKRGPYLAPLGLRLMAIAVDGALILAAFFASAMWITSTMAQVPPARTADLFAGLGLLATGFAYHWAFFKLCGTTPGMRYAGIALCTFNNEVPTQMELRHRLRAMALSLLPVGIGMVWLVFDEDHLSWHDRISGTYLRKR